MWYKLGKGLLTYRLILLVLLLAATGFMGYKASQVQLSYEFTRAIPVDNPKYMDYQNFLKIFGSNSDLMVLGIESNNLFTVKQLNELAILHHALKEKANVLDVMSIPEAVTLIKDTATQQLVPQKIFHFPYTSQAKLDSDKAVFLNLPFYQSLLYNPDSHAYLMGISLNKAVINSSGRTQLINNVMEVVNHFDSLTGIKLHVSGLPYIRTVMGNRIKHEMNWFLIGSFLLSAFTLLLFFRSFNAMLMSLFVVAMGVVWSVGTMVLLGYKITLLTALIPPLIVVIGIPNCIYFLNKFHTAFLESGDKYGALVQMVGRMGIVTLCCNIAAAIGFAVFALTQSELLREFGIVSGINIMALFFISLIFIPAVLSYLPAPKPRHVRYLENKLLEKVLINIERWTFNHGRIIYAISAVAMVLSVIGIFRLKSQGFVVDDMPKKDVVYTDLKWFESNFKGILPLEIMVATKKKNGLLRSIGPIKKIDELSAFIAADSNTNRPLSFVEGLKFAKQAYFDGDSNSYRAPHEGDMAFLGTYLKAKASKSSATGVSKLLASFIDSNKQTARITANMKDIGSQKLPILLNRFQQKANELFDTANYKVTFTGSCVTFLEGSSFIINGLKDSIIWAFVFITICMLLLFRSVKIVLCSLIPNLIPLVVTAGVMGWVGISLKPSTVLVFSVALGIVIDVTIRFLINYRQELPHYNQDIKITLAKTIHHTGISIIYTSLVLIAGFVIFCFSSFGGTNSLGWLTSLTLVVGTITNLVLLPVLLLTLQKNKKTRP